MLHNFVFEICHANNNWSMKNYLDMQIEQIRKTVKDKKYYAVFQVELIQLL